MSVDTRHPEYLKFQDIWESALDCYEGEKVVKSKGDKYLPKLSGHIYEEQNGENNNAISDYDLYLQRSVFYNFVKKITNSFNELLYRKNIQFKYPDELEPVIKNFTYEGESFLTAIKEASKNILLTNRIGLLLDYPVAEDRTIITQRDLEAQNIRPYAVFYNALNIINWRYEVIDNINTLTQVVLEETYDEPKDGDEFDMEIKTRWRVLDLYRGDNGTEAPVYRVRIFYKDDDRITEEIFPLINGKHLDYIPFFFLTSKGITSDLDYALLNDIVDMNLAHYRNSADYENALHITGSPTPVLIGYDTDPEKDEEIPLGGNRALLLNNDGEAYYMEYKGGGVTALKNCLDEKVAVISALAGRVLNTTPKNVEGPETAKLYRETEHSMLQSMAISLSEAYKKILGVVCEWMGINGDNIMLVLNTDYDIQEIEPNLLAQLNSALSTNAISRRTYFYNLQKNEMLPPEWEYEDEMNAIDEDIMNYGSAKVNPFENPEDENLDDEEDDEDEDNKDEDEKEEDKQ